MRADTDTIDEFVASDYKYGFVTDIESESLEPGLGEEAVRFISAKKKGTGVAARVAAEGISALGKTGMPNLAAREISAG